MIHKKPAALRGVPEAHSGRSVSSNYDRYVSEPEMAHMGRRTSVSLVSSPKAGSPRPGSPRKQNEPSESRYDLEYKVSNMALLMDELINSEDSSDSEDGSCSTSSQSWKQSPSKRRRGRHSSTSVTNFELEQYGPILSLKGQAIGELITKLDARDFCKLTKDDLLSFDYGSVKKCPNIVAVTQRFNNMIYWIGTSILKGDTINGRAKIICKFISIGYHLLELQNFNGVVMIVNGLTQVAIHRLKQTWMLITKNPQSSRFRNAKKHYEKLVELADPNDNYARMREIVSAAEGHRSRSNRNQTIGSPMVPYLGLYLMDLTMLSTLHPRKDGQGWDPKINAVIDKLSLYKFLAGLYFQDRNWKPGHGQKLISSSEDLEDVLHKQVSPLVQLPLQTMMDDLYRLSLECEPTKASSCMQVSGDNDSGVSDDKQRSLSESFVGQGFSPKSPACCSTPPVRRKTESLAPKSGGTYIRRRNTADPFDLTPPSTTHTLTKSQSVDRVQRLSDSNERAIQPSPSKSEENLVFVVPTGHTRSRSQQCIVNIGSPHAGTPVRKRSEPSILGSPTPTHTRRTSASHGQSKDRQRSNSFLGRFGGRKWHRHLGLIPRVEMKEDDVNNALNGSVEKNVYIKIIKYGSVSVRGPFWGQYRMMLGSSALLIHGTDDSYHYTFLEGFVVSPDPIKYTKKEHSLLLWNGDKGHLFVLRFDGAEDAMDWKAKLDDSIRTAHEENDAWLIDLDATSLDLHGESSWSDDSC